MDCLVVGAGAMGRWFARTVDASVTFVDRDPEAAVAAADACDGAVADPGDAPDADLVCVAVPIPAGPDVVRSYADSADRALADVTGAMADPLAAMREAAPDLAHLSLHPLFAPERSPGRIAAVGDADHEVVDRVVVDLAAAGNDLLWTTAAEHDAAMESVQAAAHAAVLAYALAVEDVPEPFHTPVSARLAEAVDFVTGGDARVYADVQAAFDGADPVASAAADLAAADRERFTDLYDRASEGWGGTSEDDDGATTGDGAASGGDAE